MMKISGKKTYFQTWMIFWLVITQKAYIWKQTPICFNTVYVQPSFSILTSTGWLPGALPLLRLTADRRGRNKNWLDGIQHLSNQQKTWLSRVYIYIGDEILPSYVGIIS